MNVYLCPEKKKPLSVSNKRISTGVVKPGGYFLYPLFKITKICDQERVYFDMIITWSDLIN